MMKKIITAVCFALFFMPAMAQDDVAKEYARLTTNTTGIPFGQNAAAGKFYNVRGIKMYAETYGTGKPLLIIHGNGGSIKDFHHQIPYFSKTYKVIVADSRAQGRSVDSKDSLSYEMMADDYAALLTQMKIDSAFVIGWSDGGINALLLAMRHPQKVAKLAITGANLWPDTTAVYPEILDMFSPAFAALKTKAVKTESEKSQYKLTRILLDEPHIALADLQRISVPALVIGGDHDVIKPAHTMLIAENIPKSNLWILPSSGHSTPIAYNKEFNEKVAAFFSKPFTVISGERRFF